MCHTTDLFHSSGIHTRALLTLGRCLTMESHPNFSFSFQTIIKNQNQSKTKKQSVGNEGLFLLSRYLLSVHEFQAQSEALQRNKNNIPKAVPPKLCAL